MTFPHNCFSIWSPGLLLLLSLFLYFFSHLSPADLWTDSLCRIITKHDWLLSRVLNVVLVDLLYVRKIERRLQVNGQQNKQKKKLVKAHSSMDLREGVCVCVRVEEFDLNRKSRCEKWWMLTRTKIDCVWWTAWSEAPGVTTLSDGSVGHLCLFYGCALPRTGIDALLPHRLTSPL